jgi:chitin synthase
MIVDAPHKADTPYGGRLVYTLPAGNKLFVHLKDKTKIRIKKRWSQVMYMFYLLGYTNFDNFDEMLKLYEDDDELSSSKQNEFVGFGNLLKKIDASTRKKV